MVAIHVRPEGNPAIMHLAHPIQLSIEGQMLEDSENGNSKTQNEQEPHKASQVIERAVSLRCEENKNQISHEPEEIHFACVAIRRGPEYKLDHDHRRKRGQGAKKRMAVNFLLPSLRYAQCPEHDKCSGPCFQHCRRPVFDSAVRRDREQHKRADARPDKLHRAGLFGLSSRGTTATSSTQTVPRNLLSNFSLGIRRRTTVSRRVSEPAVNDNSRRDQGCVPVKSGVRRPVAPGSRESTTGQPG